MRQTFKRVDGKTTRINPALFGVGKELPGAKSTALIEDYPAFQKAGVLTYPLRLITPKRIKQILDRIGFSYDQPEEKRRDVNFVDFTPEEIELFQEALAPFVKVPIAIRSDDSYAYGTGLGHSVFRVYNGSKESFQRLLDDIRMILFYDTWYNNIAFKQRVGIDPSVPCGLMFMPLAVDQNPWRKSMYAPQLSINAITHYREGEPYIAAGVGIGGANNTHPASFILNTLNTWHLEYLKYQVLHSMYHNPTTMELRQRSENSVNALRAWVVSSLDPHLTNVPSDLVKKIQSLFYRLKEQFPDPKYLEFAFVDAGVVALQSANITLPSITKPDIPESQQVLFISETKPSSKGNFGNEVIGRAAISVDHVVCADITEYAHVSAINDSAIPGSYLLIIDEVPGGLKSRLPFSDYSNAAAVAFHARGAMTDNSVESHIGNLYRAAGIPVLVDTFDESFLDKLKTDQINNIKVTIYANEAKQEGFVAVV